MASAAEEATQVCQGPKGFDAREPTTSQPPVEEAAGASGPISGTPPPSQPAYGYLEEQPPAPPHPMPCYMGEVSQVQVI